MGIVIDDVSLQYACGESNLDLNIEICQCFMAGFDVWLEKLTKNATKNVFSKMFFIKAYLERDHFSIAIICFFLDANFVRSLSRY